MGVSEEFAGILKSLVFITEKSGINFPLVLGRNPMAIQPREAGWSAKDVGEIPGPLPV